MLRRVCLGRRRIYLGDLARRSISSSPLIRESAVAFKNYPVDHTPSSLHQDDRDLRLLFDSPGFWKEFSSRSKGSSGLFRNFYLTSPGGFQRFSDVTLQKCHKIVFTVLSYQTVDQLKQVSQDLDRLSDLMCRVIDLCDFVRSVHPDPRIQKAATEAFSSVYEYMNVLNTTPGLYIQVKKAINTPKIYTNWTEEERTVASILEKDFAKSAINLPSSHRQSFVDLSNEIVNIGTSFTSTLSPEKPTLSLPRSSLKGMDPRFIKHWSSRLGTVHLPTTGSPAHMALSTVSDPSIRKEIYIANRTSSQLSLSQLESLLSLRAQLASLSGYESFAHMTLGDKMAKTPEAVLAFLDALASDNKPRVASNLETLQFIKGSPLNAWDRDYYLTQHRLTQRSKTRGAETLSAYFSLGTVMQGLSRLFRRLYGIRLVPRETLHGEVWNGDVRRLDVVDSKEGCVGVLYCDLFDRKGKAPNPSHFTIRCSRRISGGEVREAGGASARQNASQEGGVDAAEPLNDGLPTSTLPNGDVYQLPTISLICDFTPGEPTLLSPSEVKTLFHEMGHAMHSFCGRTALHNVSGTRCATDFAELPSVLMERFATDPTVLGLFARHYQTDEALDVERIRGDKVNVWEVESQVLMAVLDQRLHSERAMGWGWEEGRFASSAVYHDTWDEFSSLREPKETSWQGMFGHLYGYGACYYSYLFDRAIAGKVWRDVFAGNPIGEKEGRRFRDEVLRFGGARDGWACVAGVLDKPELIGGGEEAMREVGRWGVH
ncbi:zincin [Piedraia hortae CBS 480.64]|uniref:Mitochondrial intermediate peptidase n=1 Tax=Piedraia hortae CBS 480.64 TaxID=1314780 RepID=A0A6A7CAH8_9PEZI|nr:zincin [Piedraia hortae CBS 480.64]